MLERFLDRLVGPRRYVVRVRDGGASGWVERSRHRRRRGALAGFEAALDAAREEAEARARVGAAAMAVVRLVDTADGDDRALIDGEISVEMPRAGCPRAGEESARS